MSVHNVTIDGNEAAAYIAYHTNEIIAIYPITPASTMGELSDAWAAVKKLNIYDAVPKVIEMQSEAGAAGTCHGALQAGSLTTTFTASQGLLLMIPNMFKIAGELSPTVFHIAARTLATHALSIFGDHSDVMAARTTGWAMLASSSVQEAQDLALIAQSATLKSRIPFLHFFDGFRTSHEINKIEQISLDDIRSMIDDKLVTAHRLRAMSPDHPVLRGTAQNPDVFFQAREAANQFYDATPSIIQQTMDQFEAMTGRSYHLFDYEGDSDATRAIIIMGSGAGAVEEAVEDMRARGEKVGVLKVRLFRPFDTHAFIGALPMSIRSLAVLDRTKEPGAVGEPLYQDVISALTEVWHDTNGQSALPRVIGGRYGLSSKEFTPAMAMRVFDELDHDNPKNHFTIGIVDDVTHTSLKWDPQAFSEPADVTRAVFFGLGSDGTVGANKNSVKIIGENTNLYAQGYFVYDSRKAGSVTTSHLRFSPRPINSTYLIEQAGFVACHQFSLLTRMDILTQAAQGATFLLNSPYSSEEVWGKLPVEIQETIIGKKLKFFVVDANHVALQAKMGMRINTIMQTCFFALSGILSREQAIQQIKEAIRKTYSKRGETVLERNYAAVDGALAALHEVAVPKQTLGKQSRQRCVPEQAPDFVQRVTSMIIEGHGDLLPVSAMPVDGTFLTGTTKFEKRSIAQEIPIWDSEICTECGLCPLVCPHAAIRMKPFDENQLDSAPEHFPSIPWKGKDFPDHRMTIQVAPDDCTGCGVCVDICPVKSKEIARHKAINMCPKDEHLERERANFDFFIGLPEVDRSRVKMDTIKGSQMLEPLFEFSGACAGCGETPYLKLLSQLFGDHIVVANATGCSSIYGGNLPTTPWSTNQDGRGPAWINSLFEDNAEFGLGLRLGYDQKRLYAQQLLNKLSPKVGDQLAHAILGAEHLGEQELVEQRKRVTALKHKLSEFDCPDAIRLLTLADDLVHKSTWIVGGDGWAYDIGYGGLDHVLASGHDVNILVLDTGVYSNTGGQASKSTPRAAVAKFAASGKTARRKDLGMIAAAYGTVYVAQIAIGANPRQTIRALMEAESYRGPSLIIAYSQCIAHGIEMSTSMSHQKEAVNSGFWPLYRFDPRISNGDNRPFHLDSRKPTIAFKEFAMKEARFAMLARGDKQRAAELMKLAQQDVDEQWHLYEQMANVERTVTLNVEVNA